MSKDWKWSCHNEYNAWMHSSEAKKIIEEGKDPEDFYELHYVRGVGRTEGDYTSFHDSARDTVSGMKEEFDYWCRTPEGQKAWQRIHDLNGTVTTGDMMDYYASVVSSSRRASSTSSHSSSAGQDGGKSQEQGVISSKKLDITERFKRLVANLKEKSDKETQKAREKRENLEAEIEKRRMEEWRKLDAQPLEDKRSSWETSFDRKMRERAEKEAAEEAKKLAEEKAEAPNGMSSQLRTADDYRRWVAEQDKRFKETNPEIARQQALKKRFENEK